MIIHHDQIDLRTTPIYALASEMNGAVERAGAILRVALYGLGPGTVQYRWALRVRRPGGMRTLVEWPVALDELPAGSEALELQAIARPYPVPA